MDDLVAVPVRLVRQERPRAVQVILREPWPAPFVWLPKAAVRGNVRAGMRDVTLWVSEWLWRQKQEEISG